MLWSKKINGCVNGTPRSCYLCQVSLNIVLQMACAIFIVFCTHGICICTYGIVEIEGLRHFLCLYIYIARLQPVLHIKSRYNIFISKDNSLRLCNGEVYLLDRYRISVCPWINALHGTGVCILRKNGLSVYLSFSARGFT